MASGHPAVTEVAAELLQAGGNAFDAVVAAGFAAPLAEPALTSLGGGGFLLARASGARARLFDFFVDTPGRGLPEARLAPSLLPVTVHFPGSDQEFHVGLGSVAVPGNLCGLLHVHRELGRVPLRDVLAPAVRLARDGVLLNERQAYFLELLRPIKTLTRTGRELFEPGGRYLATGDRYRNRELAALLETLPRDGDREFYRGALASAIAQDMAEGGGLLGEADLAGYRVVEREPLAVDYRGLRLLTNPPPSFGGPLVALSLRLLEAFPMSELMFGEARHLALLAAVMQEVERRRDAGCVDPERLDRDDWRESERRVRRASGGTTHVSVRDAAGNVASMTTSNGEGSGYFAPGTGIMLNNMMGEDDLHPEGFHTSPPGLRVASMMAPSILLEGERVRLIVGSGGSRRIRTALVQAVTNHVDFGMDARALVDAPRLHWDGAQLQLEPGFAATAREALRARWPVNEWPVRDVYFGGVNAVSEDSAAGDARRGGDACLLG